MEEFAIQHLRHVYVQLILQAVIVAFLQTHVQAHLVLTMAIAQT